MQTERTSKTDGLDDEQRKTVLQVCKQFQRGIITAEEAGEKFLFCGCIEPSLAAEYIKLLPDNLRAVLPAVLAMMPTSDEGWAHFNRYGQFDGNDSTWTRFILECRTNTEAVRWCVLGETSPPASSDFADRIRAVYSARLHVSYLLSHKT